MALTDVIMKNIFMKKVFYYKDTLRGVGGFVCIVLAITFPILITGLQLWEPVRLKVKS